MNTPQTAKFRRRHLHWYAWVSLAFICSLVYWLSAINTSARPCAWDRYSHENGKLPAACFPDIKAFEEVDLLPTPVNLPALQKNMSLSLARTDKKIAGRVVARILVDESGNVKEFVLINQAPCLLKKICEDHIPDLKFRPAMRNGQAVPFWVNIPFQFFAS